MICKECGVELENGVNSCPSCGTTVKEPAKLGNTFSIISLVCGILALLDGGTFSTIGAIVTAIVVLLKDRKNTFAWIGLALGVYRFMLQLAAYLLVVVFSIFYFGMFFLLMFMDMGGAMYF